MMILLSMILTGVWVLLSLQRGQIKSPFLPTPTPTRNTLSYVQEAQAYFDAGKLDDPDPPSPTPPNPDAIDTYRKALEVDPNNALGWAELARIQTYSSSMLSNDTDRLARLEEALASADRARDLSPDDSTVRAIRSFVLDWYAANPLVTNNRRQVLLAEANSEAVIAYQRDPENALALAYYAEILVDQSKWLQAEKYASQAVNLGPDLMDTHRVYGYVLETIGQYNSAIAQYQRAAEITPNLTFLYIYIGRNYREGIRNPQLALDYFDKAANINDQLNVRNPIPHLEIAKTYTQQGEFFAAALNAKKALSLDPKNASTYGQLGIIFKRARNYEGAMPLLKCAVQSCTADENELGETSVEGLPLSNVSVAWYYVEYGTVLAFLSRENENYCPDAVPVLEEVGSKYGDDTIIMNVVEDSLGICRRLGVTSSLEQFPQETPTPKAPTPTPAPASQ